MFQKNLNYVVILVNSFVIEIPFRFCLREIEGVAIEGERRNCKMLRDCVYFLMLVPIFIVNLDNMINLSSKYVQHFRKRITRIIDNQETKTIQDLHNDIQIICIKWFRLMKNIVLDQTWLAPSQIANYTGSNYYYYQSTL